MPRPRRTARPQPETTEPFESAEQAWFWFVRTLIAKEDGARFVAGMSGVARPCEPVDMWRVIDRLTRARLLSPIELRVLRDYGCRGLPPDPLAMSEVDDDVLWRRGIEALEGELTRKGIVRTTCAL
jgi:hypothetical protein